MGFGVQGLVVRVSGLGSRLPKKPSALPWSGGCIELKASNIGAYIITNTFFFGGGVFIITIV